MSRKDEIVSTLENGMVVIAKRVASPAVSVRAYVKTGGVYEGRWLGGGLSHLLEHLVAGGTIETRTEEQNRDLLQRIGNDSNAYTTTDHTAYFVNTTTEHMSEAVDLVAGWVLGAKITPKEYRREYQVVQRELEMGKGEPDTQFEYLADMNRYRVSPARVPVIGYQEVIQGLSRDDVYAYYKLAYQPNNMVFAVAGDVNPEAMLAAVRKHVGKLPAGRVFSHDIAPEPPVVAPRTVVATFPGLGQARLRLGFPSIPNLHPDLYALDLLATVLGDGDSSLLVEEIRDRQKLATAIGATSTTPGYVEGTFDITLAIDPGKVDAATTAVLEELEKVKSGQIEQQRIDRAKAMIRAARVRQMQTSEDVASSMAVDFLESGDVHFTDRYVRQVQEVSAIDLTRVARKYFDRGKLLTAVMLPAEFVGSAGLPKAEDLIRPTAPTTRPAQEQPASQIVRSELPNGTVLLTKRMSTSPLVVFRMYSLGGLSEEDEKTNGLGNLTMNMLPRGTTTRSAQEIARFFDSIGGEIDAGCGGNNTWYWFASCLKDDFPKAIEAFADVVNDPAFPDTEVESMKRRVLAAIADQDADWLSQASRFFRKAYYGPLHSPYQFTVLGTAENVSGFTQQQMRDWYAQKVLRGRRVLAIFGDVDVEQAKRLASDLLGKGPEVQPTTQPSTRPVPRARSTPASRPATAPAGKAQVDVERVEVQKTSHALAGVVIGYRADTYAGDPANTPLAVGDTMCSGYGYPTGYLYEILRGRGLVYDVQAANSPGRSPSLPGTFFAYAGCEPRNVNEVTELMLENIARLQGNEQQVSGPWFERSKELAIVSDAMERQTPAAQASASAADELMGLGYDFHLHFADRIKTVRLPDVRNVARERLGRCVVTVSTPAPELVTVKKGRREYDSFPPIDLTPRGVQHDAGGK